MQVPPGALLLEDVPACSLGHPQACVSVSAACVSVWAACVSIPKARGGVNRRNHVRFVSECDLPFFSGTTNSYRLDRVLWFSANSQVQHIAGVSFHDVVCSMPSGVCGPPTTQTWMGSRSSFPPKSSFGMSGLSWAASAIDLRQRVHGIIRAGAGGSTCATCTCTCTWIERREGHTRHSLHVARRKVWHVRTSLRHEIRSG